MEKKKEIGKKQKLYEQTIENKQINYILFHDTVHDEVQDTL